MSAQKQKWVGEVIQVVKDLRSLEAQGVVFGADPERGAHVQEIEHIEAVEPNQEQWMWSRRQNSDYMFKVTVLVAGVPFFTLLTEDEAKPYLDEFMPG